MIEVKDLKDELDNLSVEIKETKDFCSIIWEKVIDKDIPEYEAKRRYNQLGTLLSILLNRMFDESDKIEALVQELYH